MGLTKIHLKIVIDSASQIFPYIIAMNAYPSHKLRKGESQGDCDDTDKAGPLTVVPSCKGRHYYF